jgi:DNA-binding PadR family transcriptional regulator
MKSENESRYVSKLDKEIKTGVISFLILQIIKHGSGPYYGYKLIRKLKSLGGDRFNFAEGTIYPILHSLERMGLVKSEWGESNNGPPRKYYGITAEGEKAASEGLEIWKVLKDGTDRVLGGLRENDKR